MILIFKKYGAVEDRVFDDGYFDKGFKAGVTGQQMILTPPCHLVLTSIYAR
jgi:hypothetical protein